MYRHHDECLDVKNRVDREYRLERNLARRSQFIGR